jgi:hypothetical protein
MARRAVELAAERDWSVINGRLLRSYEEVVAGHRARHPREAGA